MGNNTLTILNPNIYTEGWKELVSLCGNPYWVWEKAMPRIDDNILDCAIYLYPSVQDAIQGERAGGSGFLVGINSQVFTDIGYLYAVTNSHVIREGESTVIRLNKVDGSHDTLTTDQTDWLHHPDGDDIAVCSLGISGKHFMFKYIGLKMFITKEIIAKENIGIGDEIFMVGRLVNHEGKQRNTPVLRFGNIAMMPLEPLLHPRGHLQESFLVETRSLSGFSGSPVFVHILLFSKRPGIKGWSDEKGPWLLGIDWGHIQLYDPVLEKSQDEYGQDRPVQEGWKVRSNTGVTGVVPAWKLHELLNIKELIMTREENEKRLATKKMESGVVLDSSITREQFHDLVKKAAQPIEKPKSDSK